MTRIAIKDIPGALAQWDEDKIYQFMIDYLPELCPRNNMTGKDLQIGIKAIQRGKKIIEALTQQGDVKIGLNSDKLDSIIHQMREEFGVNNYEVRGDKGDYTPNEQEKFLMEDMLEGFIYELKKSIIANQKDLFEVVK